MTNSEVLDRVTPAQAEELDRLFGINERAVLDKLTGEQAIALTLYGEARGETVEGVVAVGCVIFNRLKTRRWGENFRQVVLQRWQFSCWEPKGGWDDPSDADKLSENYEEVMQMAHHLVNNRPIVGPAWTECLHVARGIQQGAFRDRVKGSTHYLTTSLLKAAPPAWAKDRRPTVVVWNHAFFAGVR
jgi:N-acetylmuramoyl-L-alanine amidase